MGRKIKGTKLVGKVIVASTSKVKSIMARKPSVSPSARIKIERVYEILRNWINVHLQPGCTLDAKDYVWSQGNRPLRYESTNVSLGNEDTYTLELWKEPGSEWLQKFTAYPNYNRPGPSSVPTIADQKWQSVHGRFYHISTVYSVEFEFLVSFQIIRCELILKH